MVSKLEMQRAARERAERIRAASASVRFYDDKMGFWLRGCEVMSLSDDERFVNVNPHNGFRHRVPIEDVEVE